MDKKKEEMLEKLRNVKAMENNNLSINGLEDEVQIEDVKFFGQATIIEEIEGEKVEKGQSIGTVGNTAVFEIADEPHLHFEILKDSIQVDPSIYLK